MTFDEAVAFALTLPDTEAGTSPRFGRRPLARAFDDLADPVRILALVADQNAWPAFIMRRLPEGIGVRRLENFDRVEVDGDAERRLRFMARKKEGAAVGRHLHRRLPIARPRKRK